MRKLWFAYLGKALVAFPGGFGTLDEVLEILTLVQTQKLRKQIEVVLYGRDYWNAVLNIDALIEWGTISPGDKNLFKYADTPDEAFHTLTTWLTAKYF
jgi:predicted Rossmann-fold nucleotide-binding protein